MYRPKVKISTWGRSNLWYDENISYRTSIATKVYDGCLTLSHHSLYSLVNADNFYWSLLQTIRHVPILAIILANVLWRSWNHWAASLVGENIINGWAHAQTVWPVSRMAYLYWEAINNVLITRPTEPSTLSQAATRSYSNNSSNNYTNKKYVLWNVHLPNALHSVCLNRSSCTEVGIYNNANSPNYFLTTAVTCTSGAQCLLFLIVWLTDFEGFQNFKK